MGEKIGLRKSYVLFLTIIFCLLSTNNNAAFSNQSNASDAMFKWKFKTGGNVNSIPLIDNGVLYAGSFDGNLYAVDIATGLEKWHYSTDNQIFSNPALCSGKICFESGNILYALTTTGELSWTYTLYSGTVENKNDEWDYYHSSPCVVGNIVYIGSENGKVVGIDAQNGNKVFECQTPSATFTIETTPLVYDNKIYFGDWNGVFFAYDLSTSQMVWTYDTKDDNSSTSWVNAIVTDPVLYKGSIYFGGRSCNLYCVDPQTGAKKWMYHENAEMWMLGGPTIVDDVVYMGSSYQHVVYAFDAINGNQKWKKTVTYRTNGKPLVDSDYVFVGTEDDSNTSIGTLCALNISDGSVKAKLNLNGQVYSSPVLFDSVIYFGCSNGYVYAVNRDEFINIKYPNTYLKETGKLDLGTLELKGTFKNTFYVYNNGEETDSVYVNITPQVINFNPSTFILAPKDSQAVEFSINLDALSVRTYNCTMQIFSYNAAVPTTISRAIAFKTIKSTGISMENGISEKYLLSQNYPNPFNPSTEITYTLKKTGMVFLNVYDILGREVARLVEQNMNAGKYSVKFNAGNLSSGIYFYSLRTDDFSESKKMLLIK